MMMTISQSAHSFLLVSLLLLLLLLRLDDAWSFAAIPPPRWIARTGCHPSRRRRRRCCCVASLDATTTNSIDFQSDDTHFGRGEMHLSAVLDEGDAVVYQTGTWFVDGVSVGDPSLRTWCHSRVCLTTTTTGRYGEQRRTSPTTSHGGLYRIWSRTIDCEITSGMG